MSKIQKLDWGMVEWVYEPVEHSSDHMKIGISTMYPKSVQPLHIHYGDEQFIYIISGYGWQKIGDEESSIEPGKYFHISAGTKHEAVNAGAEPIKKLLISLPAVLTVPRVLPDKREKTQKMERIDKQEFLKETIKELLRHNLRPLKVPLSIFDENNELVYTNNEFPKYCQNCCSIQDDIQNCEVYCQKPIYVPPYYAGASANVCSHGLSLYVLPIVYEGEILGFIKTGHIRTSSDPGESINENLPYNVPESTATGMLNVIYNISESICSHYQFCMMQVKLSQNSRVLSDKMKEEDTLQGYLKSTQDQVLNLQINQHFLFNTLNTIAGMSIREGAFNTYQAIGDLAQLFRYTLRAHESFVVFEEEINYVRNYTNLQKLRFRNQLEVIYEIPEELLHTQEVPLNFLQPVVENCFKHGFRDTLNKMKIVIKASYDGEILYIEVKDNGDGISEDSMAELISKIKMGNESHGTSMVVRKLQSVYGDSFSYEVKSAPGDGTTVYIQIPATRRKQ